MGDDSAPVYMTDTEIIYRASSLGNCPRLLWAARSGMDRRQPPEAIQAAYDKGNELEPMILGLLQDIGWTITDPQGEVRIKVGTNMSNGISRDVVVVGHYDALGGPPQTEHLLPIDVKAFGQAYTNDFLSKGITAFPHYLWQQSVYSVAFDSRGVYVPIYNKDQGQLEPHSLFTIVHPPLMSASDIIRRVLDVEDSFQTGDMPDCTKTYPCPYYYLHDEPRKAEDSIPDALHPSIDAYMNLSAKIKTLSSTRDVISEKIKAGLSVGSYSYNGASVSVSPNPARFNTAAAKALLREAKIDWEKDPTFMTPGEGVSLRITLPKQKG